MVAKIFPIRTDTACQLKWAWTTLFLNWGIARTCHRTAESELTVENFNDFHNTETVLDDRRQMLQGLWPEHNCSYCRQIEQNGGTSDRMLQIKTPGLTPPELTIDPTAIRVSPTIVEVFFNNTCNLGCLYCTPQLSSSIAAENKKFGNFIKNDVALITTDNHYRDLIPAFWKWFDTGFSSLRRLHILGGEPFYQRELNQLLEKIDQNPNGNCEFNIVTNLMVDQKILVKFVERAKNLLSSKKLKRIDITCSIDCWGPQQEYVRWGIDLEQWESNFNYLIQHKWLYISINQAISSLTIKTMPALLLKLNQWQKTHNIKHRFGGITPGPSYMKAEIFGKEEFSADVEQILSLMPKDSEENIEAYNYMKGILEHATSCEQDIKEISKLITFLDEKDRRRGTDWTKLFPWLNKYRAYVV